MKFSTAQLALALSILSFVGGSAAQLNTILAGVPNEALVVQVVCGIVGYAGSIMALIVAWRVRIEGQVQTVAANIEDPNVKETIVRKVSQLKGLEPLAINSQADETLKRLAASDALENSKIS